MALKVGFTGTSRGMTSEQKIQVADLLAQMKTVEKTTPEFHHGDCIGADAQAAALAKQLGYIVICHPGFNKNNPASTLFRAFTDFNDKVHDPLPFIRRDRNIVDAADRMIAAPLTAEEQVSSGTWTTVRYARKQRKPVTLALPSPVKPVPVAAPPQRTNAVAGESSLVGPNHRERGVR